MTNCVCGHDHIYVSEVMGPRLISRCPEKCGCHAFRPVLDWPDSEGYWWFAAYDPQLGIVDCVPFSQHGEIVSQWCVVYDGETYHREDFEAQHCEAKFTRVLEPNPFPESP